MSYVKKTPLEGDLQDVWLPHIFIKILMMNLTGVLILELQDRKSEVYFRKGQVVHIKSNHKDDRFGQFLVRLGVLQESDVEDVLKAQKKTPGMKFGDLLIRNQLLEPHKMLELLNEHHAERLYYLFDHKNGSYRYVKNSQWSAEISVFEIKTQRIYFDAVERFYSIEEIRDYTTLHDGSFLKKKLSHRVEFPLPPLPSKTLHTIQETIDVETLIQNLGQPREKVYPILFILVIANWIEMVGDASGTKKLRVDKKVPEVLKQKVALEYPQFLKKNYFDMFSVPLQLNPQKVQTNFLNLMKDYSQYKGTEKGDQILQWIKIGYNVLINKELRTFYVRRLKMLEGNKAKLVDDRTFFHGLYLLSQGDEVGALERFRIVFEKHSGDALYENYYLLTAFEIEPTKESFAQAFKDIEDRLSVIRSQPYLSFVYAKMLIFSKKEKEAEDILADILEREKSHPQAQKLLDEIRFERTKANREKAEAEKAPESALKRILFANIGGGGSDDQEYSDEIDQDEVSWEGDQETPDQEK